MTATTVAAACLLCAALSFLLVQIPGLQSTRSGNAGEAFGAAAAASSAVVLVYMARTMRMQKTESEMQRLALQAQQEVLQEQCRVTDTTNDELRRTSEALIRGLHMSLLRMAMKDPDLAVTWPTYNPDESRAQNKQFLYINQVLSLNLLAFEVGYPPAHIEATMRTLFANRIWREFWESRRQARSESIPPNTVEAQFSEIVERAYQAALTTTTIRRHA